MLIAAVTMLGLLHYLLQSVNLLLTTCIVVLLLSLLTSYLLVIACHGNELNS